MNEHEKASQEKDRQVKEQYEQALLKDRYDLVGEIETLYKNSSLRRELEKIKKEIDEMLMA